MKTAFLLVLMLAATSMAAGEAVHLFILAGQSNAVGSGTDATELPPHLFAPRSDIRFWYKEGALYGKNHPQYRLTSGNQFISLRMQSDPQHTTFDCTQGFGAEITLGRALASVSSGPVAILKFAFNELPTRTVPKYGSEQAVG